MSKTILITGCSTGIGYTLATELKNNGYQVFATARKLEDVENLKKQGLIAILLDLDDSQSIKNAVKEVLKQTNNKLDVLIHNGAYGQVGALEDVGRDVLRKQFETNVFGWHELTNLILPIMKQQKYARIIYISSILGFVAMPFRGAYNASKFAIEGLVDTLRLELKDTNIKLSLLEPGPITSNFRKNAYKQFKKNIDDKNSAYKNNYSAMINRLNSHKPAKWTLGSYAVLKVVEKVITSSNPKTHYAITFPTKLFKILVRILPIVWIDKILYKAGDGGKG